MFTDSTQDTAVTTERADTKGRTQSRGWRGLLSGARPQWEKENPKGTQNVELSKTEKGTKRPQDQGRCAQASGEPGREEGGPVTRSAGGTCCCDSHPGVYRRQKRSQRWHIPGCDVTLPAKTSECSFWCNTRPCRRHLAGGRGDSAPGCSGARAGPSAAPRSPPRPRRSAGPGRPPHGAGTWACCGSCVAGRSPEERESHHHGISGVIL